LLKRNQYLGQLPLLLLVELDHSLADLVLRRSGAVDHLQGSGWRADALEQHALLGGAAQRVVGQGLQELFVVCVLRWQLLFRLLHHWVRNAAVRGARRVQVGQVGAWLGEEQQLVASGFLDCAGCVATEVR
jgi:hypothetical protein